MPSGFTRTISWKILALTSLLGALVGTAHPQSAPGQKDELKELSLEQLGSVEVTTAAKAPEQVWKTPAAIYVITQDDIRRSGATSIPEALRLAPGVEVARTSSGKWSIGIRGFGTGLSRDVLVLIDGRSVYTTLLAGTYWEVQDTLMEDIERIEVIRGPGGTVWGPNAVNGVINIITRNSKDTQGALASLGGGNEEQGFLNTRYGGNNGKGLSYRVYAKAFNRGSEYHFDNDNYDRWGAVQGGFRADWVKNQRDSFTLQGDLYDERLGETSVLSSYTPPFSRSAAGNALLSGGNVLGRWTRSFSEGDDIQLQAYYDRTNHHELNFGDIRDTVDVDFLQRFHLGSRNHVTWGLGARASHGHEIEISSGLYFSPDTLTDQLYTAFVQDEISLIPNRLNLEAGTKILHTNFTGIEAEPSARLLWTPTQTQTLWLAFTRAVRTPSDSERDFFLSSNIGTFTNSSGLTLPFFARFNGNPNFKPEKLLGYEMGYRRLVGKNVYFDVAGFFNQYSDLFSEDLIGAPFLEDTPDPNVPHFLLPADFGNGLKGSTTGGEIAPEWRPTSFWRLRGSYSFLHMVIQKNAGSLDVEPPSAITGASPQHQVQMQSSFDLPKRVTFDFDYRFVSALPALAVFAYSSANARIAWSLGKHIELSVVGENLLQPYHVESPGDPGPNVAIKRSFYGKLLWRSQEN
jgi:iron complex outermembrane recepter protein